MYKKRLTLDLSGKKYIVFESSISELFLIESLLSEEENIEENMGYILDILGINKKYIEITPIIVNQVLSGFRKKDKKKGGRDYFLGILGMLAHHNFMDLKSFMEKYSLSDLPDLLNVREYYFNIYNDKASENSKFFDETERSEEEEKNIEDFIKKMTGG